MYKSLLVKKGTDASSYTKQDLSIVFHQPFDKSKPELLYSGEISVQEIINAAIKRSTTPETAGAMDKTQQIFHTAKLIQNKIKKMQRNLYTATWYQWYQSWVC